MTIHWYSKYQYITKTCTHDCTLSLSIVVLISKWRFGAEHPEAEVNTQHHTAL